MCWRAKLNRLQKARCNDKDNYSWHYEVIICIRRKCVHVTVQLEKDRLEVTGISLKIIFEICALLE
jgi:hypothetical protein